MKIKSLLLVLIVLPSLLIAQLEPGTNEIGTKVMCGVSNFYNPQRQTSFRPSAFVSVYHRYKIDQKAYMGMEISLIQAEGFFKTEKEDIFDTLDYYNIASHSTMAGFSFLIGWDIYKFSIDVNPQAYLLLVDNATLKGYSDDAVVQKEKIKDYYGDKYEFGMRVGINYRITQRMAISASYYQDITGYSRRDWPYMGGLLQQITVGIRYTVITSD